MSDLPDKIGKYEISKRLGHGAMGVVYLGHDPFSDADVAVKVCPVEDDKTQASRVARKLFFNEAHTAGSLDHPNILRVLDAGVHEGQPYIVMEYVEGAETLKPHVDPDNLLRLERVVEIIYHGAKALDYAHRRGVVHRDIKPTNLMLAGDGRVKIGDFGIAHYAASELTQVMGSFGSPRYMSPEQARDEEVNHQSDLFSLGVVLYELLSGRAPFAAKGISQLIHKILNEDPKPLSEHRGDLPEGLERIVRRALQKERPPRYQSGQEMASDLASVFDGLGTSEDPIGPEQRLATVRELHFFNEFSDDELEEVLRATAWEHHAGDEEIISEGHLEHSFYILVEGEVDVMKGERRISTLARGDCFGEMGYLSKTRRTASIFTLDEVTLLRINSSLMEQASMTCQLRFTQVFLHTLIERLARTSDKLARQTRDS